VLATAFRRAGQSFGTPVTGEWARRLGDSVPDWPAFPDSPDALARLARRYKLIILSNVHRAGFAASNERLRGDFAAIITAEDVGAYKPAENHFRALDSTLPGLGVDRGELLHVAQSLFHDHVPAKREGLPSVWINRRHDRPGWGATAEPTEEWSFDLECNSMADFADAVDRAFADA
jgi:putative hydrolase of the HAD superfamily